ncbi:MAG: redox-sensing transcriptional repressor Rex [Oscillospiraceae bacterium]|nr:redox-sensing transcriptional repressor Rex [Oscillospiraceae bacterium]
MSNREEAPVTISVQALQRMPYYLHCLRELDSEGLNVVSSPIVASRLGLKEIQVRKDFAAISTKGGKPKSGFVIHDLIYSMEKFLGYHNVKDAVLVGTGFLGKALLSFKGFVNYGLKIVAAFDTDPDVIGTMTADKKIFSADKISDFCRRLNIHIGIITVPDESAQIVCDQLVAGGVSAVWNFSQVHLSVPDCILVQNENMAASLAMLSKHLEEREHGIQNENKFGDMYI